MKQRGNPFARKPSQDAPENYVIGYLEQRIPKWITKEKLIYLFDKVLELREKMASLTQVKDPWQDWRGSGR